MAAVKLVEEKTKGIKEPLKCLSDGLRGKCYRRGKRRGRSHSIWQGNGMIMRHGEVVARLPESELVDRFLQEIERRDKE